MVVSGKLKPGDYCILNKNDIPVDPRIQLPQRLLKKVAYNNAEMIVAIDEKIFVNGCYICNRLINSEKVTALPFHRYLQKGECFLLNDHELSYDSRYFGAIQESKLKKVKSFLLFK